MRRLLLLAAIALLVLLLGNSPCPLSSFGTVTGLAEEDVAFGLNVGQRAPLFTLQSLTGTTISLADFKGQKVFLNFWATWCPPCRAEMPYMQRLHEEYGAVAVLAVNIRENITSVKRYVGDNGFTFPVILDEKGEVAGQYKVRAIPTTFILDETGIITGKVIGAVDYNRMLQLLAL